MIKVIAGAVGGVLKQIELSGSTVLDAKKELGLEGNYTATINGESAVDGDHLSDDDVVTFAESVKGGN